MEGKNVLIFPAGSEIAIEIYDALKYQKDIEVFGAASVSDHSEYLFKKLAKDIPYFNAPGFIDALNHLIERWSIDFIYPARDDVQLFMTENQSAINAKVVTSCLETVATCRSKKETYKRLSGFGFVPKTYSQPDEVVYPAFAKPTVGEGAKGARLIKSKRELDEVLNLEEDYVLCEYLPGDEYTVDCFTDAQGTLRVCIPRVRERIRTGISVRGRILEGNDAITNIAEDINSAFNFLGAWYFQLKQRDNGEYVLMEVSPRIPGTMGLTRNLGINYPLLTIYTLLGYDLVVQGNHYDIMLDKAFISRYSVGIEYSTVYIDYDDTILFKGCVNGEAIKFVYQCVNNGKRVVLLTKHIGNIREELEARRISPLLFDEIIHIEKDDNKANYIEAKGAIFIDDSFREKKSVQDVHGIPVFDLNNIEALIDWRM